MTWRIGFIGRTIHDQLGPEPTQNDPLIGIMDTPALATQVVTATNRATALEADNARLRDLLDEVRGYLATTHRYPATGGGHDHLGAGFSCSGCQLRDQITAVLDGEGVSSDIRPSA